MKRQKKWGADLVEYVIKRKMAIRYFYLVLLVTMVGCTPTPEQKAQNLIKEYICNHLNLPKLYEPVEFGSLDTISKRNQIRKLEEEIEICKRNLESKKTIEKKKERFDIDELIIQFNLEELARLRQEQSIDDVSQIQVTHSFRYNNKLYKYTFSFNANLTAIEKIEEKSPQLLIE